MKQTVALFGEAEKGAFKTPHTLYKLPQVVEALGNPPEDTEGLFFAVQAVLYNRTVLFFRVAEEGFSQIDYFSGLKMLQDKEKFRLISALCLPGVADPEILSISQRVCAMQNSFLITSQKDLYDFLTNR